jgi:hypothetical protein
MWFYYNIMVNISMCYSNSTIVNIYWHCRKLVYKIIVNRGAIYISHIPRRSLPLTVRAARPAEPSRVLLAMVVVVLARRRLRTRRLESPGPELPHVVTACFKCFRCFVGMFQVFSCGCCKSRFECYICCNDCTCMLQVSVPNVLSVFSNVCCKSVYLDVAYVSHICCNCKSRSGCCMCCNDCTRMLQVWISGCCTCFTHMLQVFHLDVAYVFQVFFMCFRMCCRCIFRMFQLFHMYMASVSFGCFKNRSRVLCMLQCETLTAIACYSCWGVVHGGERHNRCGGAWEAGKHGGVARAGPASLCVQ